MEIGLHLLGGDPDGYYKQTRENRIRLLAYWQTMNDPTTSMRWASMAPARLGDLALHARRSGLSEAISGQRAWLGANGVRFKSPEESRIVSGAQRSLHTSNAKRCGATSAAVRFWLG